MSFAHVIAQHRAKGILSRAIENDRVPHAYLFSGPSGVGKEALAIEFAKALFCTGEGERPCDECSSCKRIMSFQHPDFTFVFPSSAKNVDDALELYRNGANYIILPHVLSGDKASDILKHFMDKKVLDVLREKQIKQLRTLKEDIS